MISFIKGYVVEKNNDSFIIDHHGMGYRIFTSNRSLEKAARQEEVFVYTYLNVREDAITLFGFLDIEEMQMFELLITVKGIGPKVAIGILSGLTPSTLQKAIATKDLETLSKAPGVGKKTAERLHLELKDKIFWSDGGLEAEEVINNTESDDEVTAALLSLGYNQFEIAQGMKGLKKHKDLTIEEKIRVALKELMK